MAVSIVANPNALNPIENGLIWKIQLTDLGTDPIEKRAGWQLENSSGGLIVELSSTRPGSTGDVIYLDFKKNIRGLVKPMLPTIGALGVQNDTTMIKEFRLKYGEIEINKDTGDVTNNVTNTSSNYKVFAGSNNIWDTALITAAGAHLLTYRPTRYNLMRNSLDYLWILGSGTVTYTVYYSDSTTQAIVQSAPYDANIIPVGLPFLESQFTGGHTKADVVQLTINVASKTYYVGFEGICDGSNDFMEVLFQEPLGGRSVMVFQTIDGAGVNRTSNEANILRNIASIADLRASGDSTIFSRTYGTYSLRRQLSNDPDEIRWAQGFGASNEHHLLIKDFAGTRFWAKAIIDNVNLDYQGKELTASLHLAKSIEAPYGL